MTMPEPFRVVQFGLGSLGKAVAQSIVERENLELIGLVDVDNSIQGKSIEKLLAIALDAPFKIRGSLADVVNDLKGNKPDIAVIATTSSLEKVSSTITSCLVNGMDVLSICEELSFPYIRHPQVSEKLDEDAKRAGKTILGTGINPGYLMDLLPIVLSAPCQSVDKIHVTRHMNSSLRRFSFQKKIGTGMTQDEFRNKIEEGHITGHVGLVESMRMVDSALNLGLDEIVELPPEAVVAKAAITNSFTTIEKGEVLGLKSTGVGKIRGETLLTLDFLAYAEATPEYDEVIIKGLPNIQQRIEGGVQGDHGTVGMILNMIPMVVKAQPGLMTMKDMPVPRNTLNIMKDSL
ncbi:MAG: NAD(P)H-dependent amine dehydrogenase family protein [Candidatus Thorarchaeota archaeon]|jgi:4-hydroxy-tetrahydrodipicolinate reductase